MLSTLILILIVLIAGSIPVGIAFSVVMLTEHERGSSIFKSPKKLLSFIFKSITALSVLLVFLVLSSLGAFSGTNVHFQSSDGEWVDNEVLFKNREFSGILFRFELYKAKCSPNAILQRTTERPHWYEYENWFNDYSEPKWRVPYAKTLPKIAGGYRPPLSMEHCASKGSAEQEARDANEQAKQYLLSISP